MHVPNTPLFFLIATSTHLIYQSPTTMKIEWGLYLLALHKKCLTLASWDQGWSHLAPWPPQNFSNVH